MSRYERRALWRFLVLYVGSSLLLIGAIATLYLRMEQGDLIERERLLMQNHAFAIAAKIVDAHMQGRMELVLPASDRFMVGLYGPDRAPLFSAIEEPVRFDTPFYAQNERLYLVDQSTHQHGGVQYVVIASEGLEDRLAALRRNAAFALMAATLFVCVVALMLSRLFLAPIREEMARRDRFIKDSTHELSTPVSALLMSLKGLEGADPKRLRRITAAARAINDSYQNMVHLFMRDQEPRHDQPLDLAELIALRTLWLDDLAQVKQIALTSDLEPLVVRMDRNRATRLVDNLLQNGVKYTPPGGQLQIQLKAGVLRVCDSGPGIAPEDQKKIFERYVRRDRTSGGFGIGLDIVRRICLEYGIELALDSKPGAGSCFSLTFTKMPT